MKLKDMTKDELELLSYTDLTERILEEHKTKMSTPEIFRMICDLLEYTNDEYSNKIGDFYTSLTTDRRFILLDDAKWDLRKNHAIPLIIDDEDEEEIIEEDDDEDDEDIEEKLEIEDDDSIDDGIEDDVELSDLSIVDEEDLDN